MYYRIPPYTVRTDCASYWRTLATENFATVKYQYHTILLCLWWNESVCFILRIERQRDAFDLNKTGRSVITEPSSTYLATKEVISTRYTEGKSAHHIAVLFRTEMISSVYFHSNNRSTNIRYYLTEDRERERDLKALSVAGSYGMNGTWMTMKRRYKNIERGKRKYLEKITQSQCQYFYHRSCMNGPGIATDSPATVFRASHTVTWKGHKPS